MAKQVSNVFIRLGIENFEGIEKLKGAFRELDKSIGPSAASIDRARQAVLDYSRASGNTEQVIKGTIDALKGLQAQAERGSNSWSQISADLRAFEQQARRTDSEIEILRRGIAESVQGHAQSRSSIEAHIRSLRDLANQATLSGDTLGRVQQDIGRLEQQINETTDASRTFRRALNQALAVNPQAILNQWNAYQRVLRDAASSADELALAQQRLETLAGAPRISERRAIVAQAAITNDPGYQRRFGAGGTAYSEGLPDTTAAFNQRLRELNEDLTNTYRNTQAYLNLQVELATVQRAATSATQGLAAALLDTITTRDPVIRQVRSQRSLQEVISQTKREMLDLDVTTTEGFDTYTQHAARVRDLEEELGRLGRAYATAATNARQFTDTQENAVLNQAINAASTGRLAAQQRARAEGMQQLREAVTAGVAGTPALLLPAAGQTSAPGTGQLISGGSRVRFGRSLTSEKATQLGGTSFMPEGAIFAGQPSLYKGNTDLQERITALGNTSFSYRELAKDIRLARSASDGSINTLEKERAAWNRLQNAVEIGSNKYRLAGKRIEELDARMRRGGGQRGLGGRQLAQIGGAAISGGIFGGAEGFLGGVAGGIFGGVGGSFAGAAAGAQLGMLRQQLGGTAEYAAQIGKLQIALRGVAGTQDNYNQAINAAAAATRELNIPQMEATQGITRLSAAILGAGGTIGDANFAFRAISESIKATGGNAEQVDGALLALTQVFSKGKVSAEELNQIAERLPGTFTLFAKAAGKSGPELQKALQQGEVGLNDLMKFLELASSKYGQNALDIASSSEEAGARMKITFDQMRLEVGKALQPIGAELQKTFAVFAKDITPTVIAAAQGIASALKTIMDNAEAIGTIAKLGAAFFATKLAIQGFVAMRGALGVMSLAIQSFFGNITAQAAMAGQKIKQFAASIAAPLLISVGIVGVESVISEMRRVEEARKSAEGSGKVPQGDEFIRQAGGDTLNSRDLARLLRENDARFNIVLDDVRKARQEAVARNLSLNDARAIVKDSKGYPPRDVEVASQLVNVENQLLTLQSRRAAILKQIQTAKPPAPLPNPTAADTEAERAAKQAAETERRLAQEGITIEMNGQLKAHEYAIELDRRRYELQKQLSDEANAHEIANLQGGARTIAQAYATYRSRIAEIERGLVEAAQNTGLERRRLQASQTIEGVTAGTGMQGRYRQGSIGPSTGPHFDIKQVGGGRFARTDLDQYVQVNGRPLSSGLTLPGGTFDAPRAGRPSHGGIDYAFGAGAALDLKGGAQWVKLDAGTANGDVATLKLPDGRMFTVLHGKFERTAAAVTAPTAQGRSQLLREQKTAGKTDYAGLGVSQAEGLQQAGAMVAEQQKTSAFRTLVDTYTQSIRDQNYELSNSNTLNVERNRLLAAGASSKYIDYAMRLVEIRRTEADMLDRINLEEKDPEKRAEQIRKLNALYAETRDLLRQNYELSTAFDNSLGLREGAQRYVESIGTLREATAGLAQQGFKGIEGSIVSLATTGTANFAQFATSLLNDMARIIIQQLVVKQLAQAIGSLFGGPSPASTNPSGFNWDLINKYSSADGNVFGANGIVPYAKGGVVTRPMLFPFANGGAIGTGLMGEAGPEAIMPLSRGANGKLGVLAAGGGTTNVVVNVDASGNSSVQGRDDRAGQLGRVISQAVQAELIKQKRPGGILA